MSWKIKPIYETAFDCCIGKYDSNQIDRISNQSVLLQLKRDIIDDEIDKNDDNDGNLLVSRRKKNTNNNNCTEEEYKPSTSTIHSSNTSCSSEEICNTQKSKSDCVKLSRRLKNVLLLPLTDKKSLSRHRSLYTVEKKCEVAVSNPFCSKQRAMNATSNNVRSSTMNSSNATNDCDNRENNRPALVLQLPSNHTNSMCIRGAIRRHRTTINHYPSTDSLNSTNESATSLDSTSSTTTIDGGNRSSTTTTSDGRRSSSLSSQSSFEICGGSSEKKIDFLTTTSTNHHHLHLTNGSSIGSRNTIAKVLHILSPISDKSQEPTSDLSDISRTLAVPWVVPPVESISTTTNGNWCRRKPLQNKKLSSLFVVKQHFGVATDSTESCHGSDSGISIEPLIVPTDGHVGLPFDMPKLRRKRLVLDDDLCTSSSGTSSLCHLSDLPFDMPKLRRRLRSQAILATANGNNNNATLKTSPSSTSKSTDKVLFRKNLTLNLENVHYNRPRQLSIEHHRSPGNYPFRKSPKFSSKHCDINVMSELEKQGWYHGLINRLEAESVLRILEAGSFLVRNSEFCQNDYTLSLKGAKGFMHIRIQKNTTEGGYTLGQFSHPFNSVPELISYYFSNRLPIRGAEHMYLLRPVMEQLL